jgi:hypothetical protein
LSRELGRSIEVPIAGSISATGVLAILVAQSLSAARAKRLHPIIELGRQIPIDSELRHRAPHDRRAIAFRWRLGATLTGLCGVALIGSALYLGFDSQSNFAQPPEIAAPPRQEIPQKEGINPPRAIGWCVLSTL